MLPLTCQSRSASGTSSYFASFALCARMQTVKSTSTPLPLLADCSAVVAAGRRLRRRRHLRRGCFRRSRLLSAGLHAHPAARRHHIVEMRSTLCHRRNIRPRQTKSAFRTPAMRPDPDAWSTLRLAENQADRRRGTERNRALLPVAPRARRAVRKPFLRKLTGITAPLRAARRETPATALAALQLPLSHFTCCLDPGASILTLR